MNFAFWIVAGVIAVLFVLALVSQFSPEVRGEKRRRKNHGRVISKARRPGIMLQVNTRRG